MDEAGGCGRSRRAQDHRLLARREGRRVVAGQVAQDAEGTVVGRGDIEAQAVQVFENLKAVLASAGAAFDDVVKMTTYTTSLAYRPKIAEVRARYFKTYFPPNTFVVVASLATPEYLLEIEAVAAVP